MKLFTKKKVTQKMTIFLVILLLFNFIIPTYSRADSGTEDTMKVIYTPVRAFLMLIADGTMDMLQYFFVTNEKAVIPVGDQVEQARESTEDDSLRGNIFANESSPVIKFLGEAFLEMDSYFTDKPNFKYTPQSIFEGGIKFFNIDFINGSTSSGTQEESEQSEEVTEEDTWYKQYKTLVENLKNQLKTAVDNNDEVTRDVIVSVFQRLGVKTNGAAVEGDISKVTYNLSSAREALDYLTSNYNNGAKLEDLCGVSSNDERLSKFNELNLTGEIVKLIGPYDRQVNGVNSYSKMTPPLPEIDYDETSPINVLHDLIATWYKILRNIALVVMLSVLVYIGIRIMISSTAADQAKYKSMLVDWVVSLCLLFSLHYIMAFVTSAINLVIGALSTGAGDASWTDSVFAIVRYGAQSDALASQVGYTILYIVLVIYTVIFTFQYIKRVVYAAFLTIIAPFVAVTYPLDKIADGKSQAFNMWLKEYIANAIMQPVHLLIYTTLVTSALALSSQNVLFAIVVMGAMFPVEKFIREMFGLNNPKIGTAGSFAGGALAASAFNKLLRKPPIPPHLKDKQGEAGLPGGTEPEKEDKNKIKYSADTASLFKTVANSAAGTEGKPDIDEGSNSSKVKFSKNMPVNDYGKYDGNMADSFEAPYSYASSDPLMDGGSSGYENDFKFIDDSKFAGNTGATESTKDNIDNGKTSDYYENPYISDLKDPLMEGGISGSENELRFIDEDRFNTETNISDIDEDISDGASSNVPNNNTSNRVSVPYTANVGRTQESSNTSNYSNQINPRKPVKDNYFTRPMTEKEKRQLATDELRRQKRHAFKTAIRKQQIAGHKQTLQSAKALGKGILKGATRFTLKAAGGTILGAAGATVGLAGAVASGDPSNLWKMTGAGVAAGVAGGTALGGSAANAVINTGRNIVKTGQNIDSMYRQDMMENSKEYRRRVAERESRRLGRRQTAMADVRQSYSGGKDFASHFAWTPSARELRGMTRTVQQLSAEGITDDPNIAINTYNMEHGKDSKGKEIPKEMYTGNNAHTEALIAAKYAKDFNPDDEATWTSTRNKIRREMDRSLEKGGMDAKTRSDKAKEFANKQMLKVAMAKGMSFDDAKELQERKLGDESADKKKKLDDYKKQAKIQDAVNRGDDKALDTLLNG